jgi:hypothetical protein
MSEMKVLTKIILLTVCSSLAMAQFQPISFRPFASFAPFPQFPPIQDINGNQQSASQIQIQSGGGSQSQSQSGSGSQIQVQSGNSGSQIQAQTGGGSQIQVQPSNGGRPFQTQSGNGIQLQIPNRTPNGRSKRQLNNPLQNFLSLQSQEHAFTLDALKTIIDSINSNRNNLQTLVIEPTFRAQITALTNQRNRIDRLVQSLQLLPDGLKSTANEMFPEINLNELQQSAVAVLNYLNLSQLSRFNARSLLNNLSNFKKFANQLQSIQNTFPML